MINHCTFNNCSICAFGILVSRISPTFVSNVIFALQLHNRYTYLSFYTYQTSHSGQNFLNYAAETIPFEVNIKESRQFPHSCVSIVAPGIIADDGF